MTTETTKLDESPWPLEHSRKVLFAPAETRVQRGAANLNPIRSISTLGEGGDDFRKVHQSPVSLGDREPSFTLVIQLKERMKVFGSCTRGWLEPPSDVTAT